MLHGLGSRVCVMGLLLFAGLVQAEEVVSTYHVPVPPADAERLKAWSTMPADAQLRIRWDRDQAILSYSLPGHLTGSQSIGLKLEGPLDGRRAFQAGDELMVTGTMEGPASFDEDDDPNRRAHATCLFESQSIVSCAVTYASITLDPVAQERWLAAREWSPVDRAGFAEVAAILGHEAIGVVRTNVDYRGSIYED